MWSKNIETLNPYEALRESKNSLEFKFSSLKLKRSHWKLVKHQLKILKFCLHHMCKICIPVSKGEQVTMEALLSVYDETITELNKHVDEYRKRSNRQ